MHTLPGNTIPPHHVLADAKEAARSKTALLPVSELEMRGLHGHGTECVAWRIETRVADWIKRLDPWGPYVQVLQDHLHFAVHTVDHCVKLQDLNAQRKV